MIEVRCNSEALREELKNTFKLIIWVSKLFCAIPSFVNILEKKIKRKTEKLRKIVFIIQGIILAVSLSSKLRFSWLVFHGNRRFSKINKNSLLILLMSDNVLATVTYIVSILNRNRYEEIYKSLYNIHVSLTSICGYKSLKKVRYMFNVFAIYQASVGCYLFLLQHFYNRKNMSWTLYLYNLTGAYSNGLLAVNLTQYIALIYYIRYEYIQLNGYLKSISLENRIRIPTAILHYILETLVDAHFELNQLMESLNKLYRVILFGETLRTIVFITSQLSLMYHASLDRDELNFSVIKVFLIMLPNLCYSIVLWLVYYLNESTQRERNRTNRIIYILQKMRPDLASITDSFIQQVLYVKSKLMMIFRIIPMNLGTLVMVKF